MLTKSARGINWKFLNYVVNPLRIMYLAVKEELSGN